MTRTGLAAAALAALTLSLTAAPASASPRAPEFLAQLPGASATTPSGMSDRDHVVGWSLTPDGYRGWIWSEGQVRDLGGPAGSDLFPQAVNDSGLVVGFGNLDGSTVTFQWLDGVLSPLPASDPSFRPLDVDDAGRVVGIVGFSGGQRAAVTVAGVTTELAAPTDCTNVTARRISDTGQVLGSCFSPTAGGSRALVWDSPTASGRSLPAGVDAVDVNDQGWVVGTRASASPGAEPDAVLVRPAPRGGWTTTVLVGARPGGLATAGRGEVAVSTSDGAALWRAGRLSPLPQPEGSFGTGVEDANDLGHVVASSFGAPVLWR